jgi:mannitol-1-phosphate/altronate dehydrogenase
MKDLAELLVMCFRSKVAGPLSVINTDNVPGNGPKIQALVPESLEGVPMSPFEVKGG